jgi:hypothetical protein
MSEPFLIPVVYRGTEHEFKANFERWGCIYRIAVQIGETKFIFEPDEGGCYRVLGNPEQSGSATRTDLAMLQAVAEILAKLSH